MKILSKTIKVSTNGNTDIIDVTENISNELDASNLNNGIVTVFVPGSTGGITTIEYESGVISDLKDAFDRVAPLRSSYKHDARWGDGNGHSHVRASVAGASLTIPFEDGELQLGTWQQVVFIDFDNRSRKRTLLLKFIGD